MSGSQIQLLYVSKSLLGEKFAFDDLFKILETARRLNAKNNITGALILSDSNFAQILEGPTEAVEETFSRIKLDRRHQNVVVVSKNALSQRAFPQWAMAHPKSLQRDAQEIAQLFDRAFRHEAAVAKELLKVMSDGDITA